MRLILVRHGETECNRQRLVQGCGVDVDLNETGRLQAERLGQALHKNKLDAVYASSMRRAQATAQAIANWHSLNVVSEPDLREIDAGTLNRAPVKQMGDLLEDYFAHHNDARQFRMPGGESFGEMADRVWGAARRIVNRHPAGEVVVVGHHLVILFIICQALGLELRHFRRMKLGVAAVSILEFKDGRASLAQLNDTCHLDGLDVH